MWCLAASAVVRKIRAITDIIKWSSLYIILCHGNCMVRNLYYMECENTKMCTITNLVRYILILLPGIIKGGKIRSKQRLYRFIPSYFYDICSDKKLHEINLTTYCCWNIQHFMVTHLDSSHKKHCFVWGISPQ